MVTDQYCVTAQGERGELLVTGRDGEPLLAGQKGIDQLFEAGALHAPAHLGRTCKLKLVIKPYLGKASPQFAMRSGQYHVYLDKNIAEQVFP